MYMMDDYYKDLISGKEMCSWIRLYYGVVSKVINENNFKKCAEVGIGYGLHAKEILDNTNIDHLYLIDPTKYYLNDDFANDVLKYGGFENLVKNIKLNLQPYNDKYTWYRKCSTDITNDEVPDEHLDLVFIDADHSYQAVTNDLNFWWKKIRKGGWLLGDDYGSIWPETKNAVNDWATKMNFKIQFLFKPDTNYPIYYFIKDE
tara:strand:- start:1010 stop:1618 length:609 start_codon:yes stop_codon:yes gene_type:complete